MVNDPADPRDPGRTDGPLRQIPVRRNSAKSDVDAIVKKYDAESNFRNLKGITAKSHRRPMCDA